MNDLKVFSNNEFGQVRTVTKDNEIWFIGKDIANKLGYANVSDAIKNHVDDEDKKQIAYRDLQSLGINKEFGTKGGQVINESGLYSLVLSSKILSAKKFKRWITSEVLPSIRKHGAYMTDDVLNQVINNPDFGIKLLTELKKEKEEKKLLELQNKQKEQLIGELKPKADYTDKILRNKGLVNITQIAKDYGMSGTELNKLLHKLGVQYKQSNQWLLYSKYQRLGYTQSQTIDIVRSNGMPDVKMNTKWTQKGRLFLYDLLGANGVLPVIEQSRAI